MAYSTEFKQGVKVEREHKSTYNLISKKKDISENKFYGSIARDHLKEDKNYYKKLKKANL
jgi:hypothetical protein